VETLYDQMLAVVEAPLDSLIQPSVQVRAGAVIDRWRLPESDCSALRTWGLPEGPLLDPTPQVESDPVLAPNIASEAEHRLLSPEQRLYLLGTYGADFDPQYLDPSGCGCWYRPSHGHSGSTSDHR